jgi:V/A-type H+/Na+-transporting ATPase subunit I
MVERMQKLTVLMLRSGYERFLQELQDLGVVHVEQGEYAETEDLTRVRSAIQRYKKVLHSLAPYKQSEHDGDVVGDIETLCHEIDDNLAVLSTMQSDREKLIKDITLLQPWGRFDPELIRKLEQVDVSIRFYTMPQARFMKEDFADCTVEIIDEDKRSVQFVIISRGSDGQPVVDYPEERLPSVDGRLLESGLNSLDEQITAQVEILERFGNQSWQIERHLSLLTDELEYLVAGTSLVPEAGGEVMCLTGFVPVSATKGLIPFLEERSVVHILDHPGEDDVIPVKLRNRPFARLFEPITRIFGLPQYTEMDPTPFFAPFFALFFGLCFADFGYGVIVLVGSAVAYFVMKKKTAKSIAALGIVLGAMTIVGGLLLDTLFGKEITGMSMFAGNMGKLAFFYDIDSAMYLAVALGIIQVLFGFVLQAVNRIRVHGFFGGLQPIGTFLLIAGVVTFAMGKLGSDFAIGPIPAGRIFHVFEDPSLIGLILVAVGIALVLLFNNINKKIWIRPLLGLWEMYGIASGVPGDILSYIRLFALGLAGGLLGDAINRIALMVAGDTPGIVTGFFMVLVLIGGHAINFAMAALGAFVHPLRLTFVEFYRAVGFAGGGKQYKPYMRTTVVDGGST